jgi:hypothetical protein
MIGLLVMSKVLRGAGWSSALRLSWGLSRERRKFALEGSQVERLGEAAKSGDRRALVTAFDSRQVGRIDA